MLKHENLSLKKGRRFLSFLLAITLLALSIAGCAAPAKESETSVSTEAVTEAETTSETASEATEASQTETETKETAAEAQETASEAEAAGITVTDQMGRTVTLEAPAKKVVSSYYLSTALLLSLGCKEHLVGIEMKADTRNLYKLAAPELLDLPAVGSGKGINVEETAALEPDVVILPKRLSDSVASFEDLGIPVIVVDPETQENFEACIELLSQVTGTEEKGTALLDYIHTKMEEIAALTKDLEDKPSVYLASGSDYLSTCTSKMYQNDLIAMAGGTNVSAELTDGYWQTISPEQLVQWNPSYIFAVSYAEYSLDDIKNDSALSSIAAISENRVMTFPSSIEPWDYPTPSSVLGVLWLTYQLHPDLYTKEQYVAEAQNFYETFFQITVTEEDLGL